ncbi:MAG: hypothetical protein CMJ34_01245 [Phycisphaerae bacterium]|nr:hypothetical protein [Phycisphaerae bacterium]
MPAPNEDRTSGTGSDSIVNTGVDRAEIYRAGSLQECADRYRADPRRYEWLALGRGLAARLGVEPTAFEGCREEVLPDHLPATTVFMLGAAASPGSGCMGHVAARPTTRTIGLPPVSESRSRISGSASVIEPMLSRLLDVVRPLAPDISAPRLEVVTPVEGVGDSHALAIAVSAMHALVGAEVPPGTAASGGFDVQAGCFRSVPPGTLVGKAEAAARWGVRRILVVEGQEIPEAARLDGLDWIELPCTPAALPLQVLELARSTTSGPMPPGVIDALRLALAVYDLQVARHPGTDLETILDVTGSFLSDDESEPGDAILAFLAADIRSRVLLHAGRSPESATWNRRAISLLGRGDLPSGLLGDHLLYEHPAHASVIAMDLGILEPDGDDGEPHRRLDAAIDDLDGRWCTRHQVLLRLFARNTRWRRRLHQARWHLDADRLVAAEADLMAERDRWHELLAEHATDGLRMGNSDLSRQWNYVLEHLVTDAALTDPERFVDRRAGSPGGPRERLLGMPALLEELRVRALDVGSLSAFDLRGLLQGWWLLGEADDAALDDLVRSVETDGDPRRHPRWAEWLWRFGSSPHRLVGEILGGEIDLHRQAVRGGIGSLLALRRAAMLDLAAGGGDRVESIAPPEGPETLVRAFEDLRSTPSTMIVRAPY